MKRSILLIMLSVIFLSLCQQLFSAEKGSARILIYSLNNELGPGSNAQYSSILAESFTRQIGSAGQYVVVKSDAVKPAYRSVSTKRTVLEREMEYTSRTEKYDVIISGSYRASGNTIRVISNIYMSDTGKITSVITSGYAGVSLTSFIEKHSDRLLNVIRKYYSGTIFGPGITPSKSLYEHYTTVKITSEPGAEIYYTMDGSKPTAENGIRYTKPFDIFRSHTITAVSYKNGGYSSVSKMDYIQKYRVSPFELKALYGYGHFLSPGSAGSLTDSPVVTLSLGWEIANNDAARKAEFFRDLGLMFRGDFASTDCDGEDTLDMQNYTAGFFYRIRLGSSVMIDIPVTGGLSVQSYAADGDHSISNNFYKSGSAHDTSYSPVVNTSLLFNWEILHIGLALGPTYTYIMNSDQAIQYIALQGGLLLRF